MGKAYAVGERHLILGFRGVGFEIVPVDDPAKLPQELMRLAREKDAALILLTESIAGDAAEVIEEFRERSSAIVTTIPTHEGTRHLSFEETRKIVERSLGVDVLGKE